MSIADWVRVAVFAWVFACFYAVVARATSDAFESKTVGVFWIVTIPIFVVLGILWYPIAIFRGDT